MPSPPEHTCSAHASFLLTLARASLAYGVAHGHPPVITRDVPDPSLLAPRATFVTLERHGRLRGCIGRIEAVQPLVDDVNEHATAAAIHDPRFGPVQPHEVPEIVLSISILTPPEPMAVRDETDLLQQLTPGTDGLILREGRRAATFLPSVWEELTDPAAFVQHLKMKAGWPANYWSPGIRVQRYRCEYLSEKPQS